MLVWWLEGGGIAIVCSSSGNRSNKKGEGNERENHTLTGNRYAFCGHTKGDAAPRLDPETKSLTYDALLGSARKGESGAFEQLCEQATPRIYRTLCRITRNREDAEDALQEALMKAFVNLARFDGRSSFSTWLTRIALNAAFMKLRRSRLSREVTIDGSGLFGNDQGAYQLRISHRIRRTNTPLRNDCRFFGMR